MSRLAALIWKEFLALLKDPKSRFVIIGPPLIQLIVFGYAATFDVTDVPLAVYNESPGEASRDLVARFEGSPNFRRVTITNNRQCRKTELGTTFNNLGNAINRNQLFQQPVALRLCIYSCHN